MPDTTPAYSRVLLKLSGEALMGDQAYGIDPKVATQIAQDIGEIQQLGVQVGVVIGGGNIFRGLAASAKGMDRATADYMGMLATVINALALQDALEKIGVTTRVVTAIEMRAVAEPFIRRLAVRHLEKGRVVVLAAGTGNPYFTTDTAAALRANEIRAEVILKGTKVDGIYTADPMIDKTATRYETISYLQVIGDGLTLVRREFPTAIGPVDLLLRDPAGGTIAVEVKRRGDIDGVEQLTRYLELLDRDPHLSPVTGVFAAQEIKPQAKVLAADRGIRCVTLDYEGMKGVDSGHLRLF